MWLVTQALLSSELALSLSHGSRFCSWLINL
jgi:hypothetical protein